MLSLFFFVESNVPILLLLISGIWVEVPSVTAGVLKGGFVIELSKQGRKPISTNMGSQPLPSLNAQSNQSQYPTMFYPSLPGQWDTQPMFSVGASIPVSSYYIVHMSQQLVQTGAYMPEALMEMYQYVNDRCYICPNCMRACYL
jgi:hypothetical protein